MKETLLIGVAVGMLICGCGGTSSQALQPISQAEIDRDTITVKATKDQAMNAIINVMTSYGYTGTSVNPQMAVFEKQFSSNAFKAIWGYGGNLRTIFLISEESKDIKIRGDIKMVIRGNTGIAASFSSGGEDVRDLSGKEKFQRHLKEILDKIKLQLAKKN